MELRLPHVLHLYNVFCENMDSDNCAQVLEEEFNKMYGIKSLDDEHDCNVISMNSLNIHDANDMPSPKLGDAMYDEHDIFSAPSFDEQIYNDDSMPPIYDDYNDESGFEECRIMVVMIPLFWRVWNLIIILMKVDLERS